jgi:hypothetical protein
LFLHLPLASDLAVILSGAKDPENSNSPLLIDPFQPRRQPFVSERPKINLQKEEDFQRSKEVHFLTTFHHQSTTISPSKNHVLHTTFRKNPCKNPLHHLNKFFSRYHKKTPWPTLKTPS